MLIETEAKSDRARSAGASHTLPYVLILAGGDGVRLRPTTRALSGDERPKQFCALVGRESLLVQTERRAALVAPRERILLSLTRRHEPWYRELVAGREPFHLVIQPDNRGTATAVLYGLLRIATRTGNPPVVLLPSDHWVSSDPGFMLHVQAAIGAVEERPDAVVLLGVEPSRPETEFGWIVRGEPDARSLGSLSRVARFVEKPAAEEAGRLQSAGRSLWNTAVVVARLQQLLFLLAMARPELVDEFLASWHALGTPSESAAVERIYARLPAADFSRDVLAVQSELLSVLTVGGVAWEDLGRPGGILEARRRSAVAAAAPGTPPAGRRPGVERNARA
jgi:mannose-1-phosphate guanylyltransferase